MKVFLYSPYREKTRTGIQAKLLDFDIDVVYWKQRRLIFCLHIEIEIVVVLAPGVALILVVVSRHVHNIYLHDTRAQVYVIPQQLLP